MRGKRKKLIIIGLMLFFSFGLTLPQLLTGQVIMGSDSLFHFNRFYDAAMQLKTENFSYFASLYGFQQSGRIINALYGPLFAYLHGGLLLLTGTWFRYQILSCILLGFLASSSMFALLRQVSVKSRQALALSLIYTTTFSI